MIYRPRSIVLILCLVCASLVFPGTLKAETGKTYTLDECIRMALEFSPALKEARQDVAIAETRLDEAKGNQYPQVEILALAGPAPDAEGDQIHSDYESDEIQGLGPFGSIRLSLVQPLYTFGKISSAKKAAEHGINYEQSRVVQKGTDITLEIKRYYYGLLFAKDGELLVDELSGYLDSALDRTRKLVELESAYATEMDLNKLEAFKGVVHTYREKAVRSQFLAREALRTFMGLPPGHQVELAERHLEPIDPRIEDPERYEELSRELRPEYTQLKEGLVAKEELVKMAKADYFPVVFLGAFFSYAYAPDRDKVDNPWIYDEFNHTWGGVGLGAKWSINFGITGAKVNRSKAEYFKLKQTQDYAETAIPLEVEKTYQELLEAQSNVEALEEAQKSARKWLIAASANYDMGLEESKELADALMAYGTIRMDYLNWIYKFNLAYARLLQVSGQSAQQLSQLSKGEPR